MSLLRMTEIALLPIVTFALLWVARALSMRLWRSLPANAFTHFLYRTHKVRPPYTDAERRDWQAWFWPLFIFVVMMALLIYTDPLRH